MYPLFYQFCAYGIHIILQNVEPDIRATWFKQENFVTMVDIFGKSSINSAQYIALTLPVPCIWNSYNTPKCPTCYPT